MIRSIAFFKSQLSVSAKRSGSIEIRLQRRLFVNGSNVVGNGADNDNDSDNSKDDERRAMTNAIAKDDSLRHSMVYSIAMASLKGSGAPPLSRRLNDREWEQIRISKIQRRLFRTDSAATVIPGERQLQQYQQQQRNNSSAEQQYQDHETLLRALVKESDLRNSLAYSLALANISDETGFPSLTHSLNEREREQVRISQNQLRYDRMIANEQIYGDDTIGSNSAPLMTNDNTGIDTEDSSDDFLSMAYSLSFASSLDEGSVQFPSLTRPLNERESNQLRISKSQLSSTSTYPEQRRQQQHHLPRTLQDALLPNSEAIVITEPEKPFRVLNINSAWEGLCGYSYAESKGKSLGSLLGGKETDQHAVTALIHQLFVHGEEATTVLTNYTKEGRKFRNRLSVGPLYDEESGKVSHFVGVLKEVSVAV